MDEVNKSMRNRRLNAGLLAGLALAIGSLTMAEPHEVVDPYRGIVTAHILEEPDDVKGDGSALQEEIGPVVVPAPPLQSGWPVTVGGGIDGNPAVADLDGDGDLEVVFGSFDGKTYAFHHNGSLVAGWPRETDIVVGSAALADIDADGLPEIFIGSLLMHGLDRSGEVLPGWPQMSRGGVFLASPTVERLRSDESFSILAGTASSSLPGNEGGGLMHVWDAAGAMREGWPQSAVVMPGFSPASFVAASAVGDLTGDGSMEIVAGAQDRRLYVWNAQGESLPGLPRLQNGSLNGEAALGDVDADRDLEIAIGTASAQVVVLNSDGTTVRGWPQAIAAGTNGGIALGDIDDDGRLEVCAATVGIPSSWVYLWNGEDGTLLPGWPQFIECTLSHCPAGTSFNTSPILGDIDGDGEVEIVLSGSGTTIATLGTTFVWAWNVDGGLVEGFPFAVVGMLNGFSEITIVDLDEDGDVEIGFGTMHPANVFLPARMFFFDLPAPYDPSTMEWPTLSHDFQRTGRYSPPPKRRIPLGVLLRLPFFSLVNPPGAVVMEFSSDLAPTGGFAVTAVDGVEVEPIQASEPTVEIGGRPGLWLARFPGPALAGAISQVSPGASQVILTIRAPRGVRAELIGEVSLTLR